MVSVWLSQPSGITKLDGNLDTVGAAIALAARAASWVHSHPTRTLDRISGKEIHLIERGRPVAHLYVELYSPPTKPIGGDIYRRAGAPK